MKKTSIALLISIIILGVFLTGCSQTVVKYQCQDGSFKETAELCSEVSCQTNCPELDCSVCPVKTEFKEKNVEKPIEVIKYQCTDETVVNKLSDCLTQEDKLTSEPIKPETNSDDATMGKKNALNKALSYLDFTAFSYTGLIKQLEFEGFSHEEAVYGSENCGADWNKQAALKAQSYLDYTAFSRDGLIKQLEFEGFTRKQSEYGAEAVGY